MVVTSTSPLPSLHAASTLPAQRLFSSSTSSFPFLRFCSSVSVPAATTTSLWYLPGALTSVGGGFAGCIPASRRLFATSAYESFAGACTAFWMVSSLSSTLFLSRRRPASRRLNKVDDKLETIQKAVQAP